MLTDTQMQALRVKHPELTDGQIRSLYTPCQNVVALRQRAKALGSMTDALSEMASKDAGRPLRYVNGMLYDAR